MCAHAAEKSLVGVKDRLAEHHVRRGLIAGGNGIVEEDPVVSAFADGELTIGRDRDTARIKKLGRGRACGITSEILLPDDHIGPIGVGLAH